MGNKATWITGGSIGIGTASPNIGNYSLPALTLQSTGQTALEISSSQADADGSAIRNLAWGYGTNSIGHKEIATIQVNSAGTTANQRGGDLLFRTKPDGVASLATRLVIRSDGNVGIGTSSPARELEVNGGMRLNTTNGKPTCDATQRGTFWVTQGAAGVKENVEVCAKDAANVYAWRTIY